MTLGFGFKSYVSYKMRLRKQKEVQKENEFYMQLLQQALPPEQQMLQRQEREAEEGKLFLLVFSIPCCSQGKPAPAVLRSCCSPAGFGEPRGAGMEALWSGSCGRKRESWPLCSAPH